MVYMYHSFLSLVKKKKKNSSYITHLLLYTSATHIFKVFTSSLETQLQDCRAPLSMRFPRQEYWNGMPFPSSGDLSDPGSSIPLTLAEILYC